MKAYFQEKNLVVEAEDYTENIALDTWARVFFGRVDLNKLEEWDYYLLLKKYYKELEDVQK